MKNRISGLTALMALAGVLAVVPMVRAADDAASKPRAARAARPAAGARLERAQVLAKELGLSDEQKTKVMELLKKEADKGRALRDDTSLAPEKKREKMRGLRDEIVPEMKKILTADQFEKWEKIRSERRNRGGGQGGEAPRRKQA